MKKNPASRSTQNGAARKPAVVSTASSQTLRACVGTVLNEYFAQVDHDMVKDLYEMVLSEVEAPLLEVVMQHARSNQSRAAEMLGLNRGTLRKKLRQYDMLE